MSTYPSESDAMTALNTSRARDPGQIHRIVKIIKSTEVVFDQSTQASQSDDRDNVL